MFINPKILSRLSPAVQKTICQLGKKEQEAFWFQFPALSKDPMVMTLLAIFFPIQFFLIGEIALGVAFILTGYGCFIWWVVEWFLASGRTRKYNDAIALSLIKGIEMSSRSTMEEHGSHNPPPPPLNMPPQIPTSTFSPPLAAIPVNEEFLIHCGNCHQELRLPAELKGTKLQCPHCSALINN